MQIPQKLTKSNCHFLFKHSEKYSRSRSEDMLINGINNINNHSSIIFCKEKYLNIANINNNKKQVFVLKSFKDAPDVYYNFLRCLIQTFADIKCNNIDIIEYLCKELLRSCQTNQDVNQFNLHFSMFYEKIFRDRIIKVI